MTLNDITETMHVDAPPAAVWCRRAQPSGKIAPLTPSDAACLHPVMSPLDPLTRRRAVQLGRLRGAPPCALTALSSPMSFCRLNDEELSCLHPSPPPATTNPRTTATG